MGLTCSLLGSPFLKWYAPPMANTIYALNKSCGVEFLWCVTFSHTRAISDRAMKGCLTCAFSKYAPNNWFPNATDGRNGCCCWNCDLVVTDALSAAFFLLDSSDRSRLISLWRVRIAARIELIKPIPLPSPMNRGSLSFELPLSSRGAATAGSMGGGGRMPLGSGRCEMSPLLAFCILLKYDCSCCILSSRDSTYLVN